MVVHEAMDEITTSEIAASFGADLILLNAFDVFNPFVAGLAVEDPNETIHALQKLVGRPIGANLEPVDLEANMSEDRLEIPAGRTASKTSRQKAEELGLNFVCLTGNPGTGVSNRQIAKAIKTAKEEFSGLIIAGKMHSAGVDKAVVSEESVKEFIEAGADVILVPAVGTVPGFTKSDLVKVVKLAHSHGVLIISTIGTSQEGSGSRIIEDIALRNKACGVDIQHIGDAAWGTQSPFENIYPLSRAIRGERHTISRMARSINR